MLRHELKDGLLDAVYQAYDKVVGALAVACHRDCTVCCTHNVSAGTLEVDRLMRHIEKTGRDDLLERALTPSPIPRMQPAITINSLADYCLRQVDPPQQEQDYEIAPCPLREKSGCPVYEGRPFACRSMWSQQRCFAGGEAIMSPLMVSLNGVFEQIVEHLDQGGLCGNMIDVMRLLHDGGLRADYRKTGRLEPSGPMLMARPNPGFLVPPTHRPQVMRALNLLWEQEIEGVPFREAMAVIGSPQ
ncbi:hypothetical protein ACFL2Q_16010 [Thermodesulfobacteriota bacterium]